MVKLKAEEFDKIILFNGIECYEIHTILGTHFRVVDGYGLSEVGICFNCHQLFYKEYKERKFCSRECYAKFRRNQAIEKKRREEERVREMLENCLADI